MPEFLNDPAEWHDVRDDPSLMRWNVTLDDRAAMGLIAVNPSRRQLLCARVITIPGPMVAYPWTSDRLQITDGTVLRMWDDEPPPRHQLWWTGEGWVDHAGKPVNGPRVLLLATEVAVPEGEPCPKPAP